MGEVRITRTPINQEALTERLRTVFGERFGGISGVKEEWIFHFKGEASPQDETIIKTELEAHDRAALTPEQQRLSDRAAAYARLKEQDMGGLQAALDNSKDEAGLRSVVQEILNTLKDWQKLLEGPNAR